jgi:hypothetical protein
VQVAQERTPLPVARERTPVPPADPPLVASIPPLSNVREPQPEPVRLRYDDPTELSRDYVQNLSMGGAFIRSERSLPLRSRVRLTVELPGGESLEAPGTVVHVQPSGMGIQFELDPGARARLAQVIERLASRPRRVLLAGLPPGAGADLEKAGVQVLRAEDGTQALHRVLEELLTLDALVVCRDISGKDAEALLRLIRGAGGERELKVVVVCEGTDVSEERRLRALGADAVARRDASSEALAGMVLKLLAC